MSGRQPWWYSGDEGDPTSESVPPPEAQPAGTPPVDWSTLLTGAQKLVDWATDRVIAPHSEHGDPQDHPDCMVCRTMVVAERFDIGIPRSWPSRFGASAPADDVGDIDAESDGDAATAPVAGDPDEIMWITISD